jgi:hypothetical protein
LSEAEPGLVVAEILSDVVLAGFFRALDAQMPEKEMNLALKADYAVHLG